jgi:hypothetical protein
MDLKPGQSPYDICIFCLDCRSSVEGKPCRSYLSHHEFPEPPVKTGPRPKGIDPKLCPKCGLHPKNPKYSENGCDHAVPAVA